jgi:hypothetical protein
MTTNELRQMIIENFILHYTSDDAEREQMIDCAFDYCKESDVEFSSSINLTD